MTDKQQGTDERLDPGKLKLNVIVIFVMPNEKIKSRVGIILGARCGMSNLFPWTCRIYERLAETRSRSQKSI